jgi:magnesium transporter
MDPRFLPLYETITVREALHRIRKLKPRFTRQLYIIDDEGRLQRMVEMHRLALAEASNTLVTVSQPVPAMVMATATREEVVEQLEQHRITDLPVVDIAGRLIGIIRYDALMEVMREESSVDILTMVGASRDERALSNVGFVVRKRLPWLSINLLTAFLAAAVVGLFEDTIAKFTALAVLLPVVAGQSGNTGAQALAVTMRGLALREIGTSQWLRVARKEVGAGFINGVAIALMTSLGVLVWSSSAGLALVIGSSMIIAMVAAAFSGVIIPVTLSSLGQDPAQSSSIILTTVTDVVGFFAFLGIATLLLSML